MKRAVLLYNPKAGKGKIEKNINRIVDIFLQAGYDMQPLPIRFGANPFDWSGEVDLAVVAGGDGTMNYVVNAMMNRGLSINLGIIPAGTANDFAGAIGVSNNVLKAAYQVAHGEVELIDCGMVEQMQQGENKVIYFVNIFSFGIFTTTSQRTPEELKHRIGKMAYLVAAFKELRNIHGIPLTITTDAGAFYYPTLMGLVFNGATAGRMPIARKSSLIDGVFDCIFLRKRTPLMSAIDMLLYMIGIKTTAVKCLRTSQLKLVTPANENTDVDGQRGGHFPMKVKCLHGALSIICPKTND
ncbi:MAG: YegS/Rv2252/BmrU family lipid kinase [Alistipes sp.]|nr:YegS/Rv2252/BmrU family lipid kinase [Alistipes sp.]